MCHVTYPKATYLVSIHGAGCSVIKNWEPFVCLPLLAIPTIPLLSCAMEKSSSEMEEKMDSKELQHKEGLFEGYQKKSRANGTREETEPLAARFTRNRELARTLKLMLLERGSKCKKSRLGHAWFCLAKQVIFVHFQARPVGVYGGIPIYPNTQHPWPGLTFWGTHEYKKCFLKHYTFKDRTKNRLSTSAFSTFNICEHQTQLYSVQMT